MTYEEIENIFSNTESNWKGDNAFQGLQIIAKYFNPLEKHDLIAGADHDIIYSVSVEEMIEKKITEEDVIKLAKLNWCIEHESFCCFV